MGKTYADSLALFKVRFPSMPVLIARPSSTSSQQLLSITYKLSENSSNAFFIETDRGVPVLRIAQPSLGVLLHDGDEIYMFDGQIATESCAASVS